MSRFPAEVYECDAPTCQKMDALRREVGWSVAAEPPVPEGWSITRRPVPGEDDWTTCSPRCLRELADVWTRGGEL